MPDPTTPQHRALRAVDNALIIAQHARAKTILEALELDRQWLDAEAIESYTLDAWDGFIDLDVEIPRPYIVDILWRAAMLVTANSVLNFTDEIFGDRRVEETLADGRVLTWLPDDDILILGRANEPGSWITLRRDAVNARTR